MTDIDFDQYSQQSVHFFSRKVPELLANSLAQIEPEATLVDVGCGDGHIVWALSQAGYIPTGSRVIGVDISPIRLRRFSALTNFESILAIGHFIPALESASVDLVMSTMVIEHVPDDLEHVLELARITRPDGLLYLSTVIRKRGAWYFRKAPDGRRVLDTTHLREYPSADAVIRLIEAGGFVVRQHRITRLVFPIAHPLVRWWHARRPIQDVQRLFLKRSTGWLEALALPIPRYQSIEMVAQRVVTPPVSPLAPDIKNTVSQPAFRILIVIPTLGERLDTLCRTITSIQDQAGVQVDMVLVAKACTAELSAVAQRHRVSLIFCSGNISAAINAGFAQAGDAHRYAGWLGDDDMLRPHALLNASALLERNPTAVAVYGTCDYIDLAGELLFSRRPPPNAPALLQFIPGLIKQEACLFRLSALRSVGGLNEELNYVMDLDLLLKLRRLGPFIRANDILAAFGWHPGSMTIANRNASLAEAQSVQGRHARGLAWLLQRLSKYPVRCLVLGLNSRINRRLRTAVKK